MEPSEFQEVCRKIAEEKEPKKAIQMISELRAQLHAAVEEAREIVRVVGKRVLRE